MDCYKFILCKALWKVWNVHCSGHYAFFPKNHLNRMNSLFLFSYLNKRFVLLFLFFSFVQYLKNDLMRQFDSQVNDFVDSLIEESATLEPAPLPAVFSPPLSDKERNKLRCCHLTYPGTVFVSFSLAKMTDVTVFCTGIFDLFTAKASSLSVAGPSWSKLTGGSEGTVIAVPLLCLNACF